MARRILFSFLMAILGLWSFAAFAQQTGGEPGFPPFIKNLPEVDVTLPPQLAGRLHLWLFQGESGQTVFSETSVEVPMPEHKHGDQWGIVIDGKIDITIGGETRTYGRGETYFIPGGTPHRARLNPGLRLIEFFADRDRWRPRPTGK